MEVKKYNPSVIKPLAKIMTKPKPKTTLEAIVLSLENKKLAIIHAKGLVKTSTK